MMGTEDQSTGGNPDQWEEVELEGRKPAGVVVSVRMPADLYHRIDRYAEQNSITVSEVVRRAAEMLVSGAPARGPISLVATANVTFTLASPFAAPSRVTWGARSGGDWPRAQAG